MISAKARVKGATVVTGDTDDFQPTGVPLESPGGRTVALMPEASEYGAICRRALAVCQAAPYWRAAWDICDAELQQYHWIHVYPNAAAQIVALWFGHDDFDRMLSIICGIGHDVDCNAAQILCAYGIAKGQSAIPDRWIAPLGTTIHTYMRRPRRIEFDDLVTMTEKAAAKWM